MEADQLDLSQTAFLCAIPNNPTLYDPLTNMQNTLGRRDRILDQMLEDGKIAESACLMAKAEEITLNRPAHAKNNYVENLFVLLERQGLLFNRGHIYSSNHYCECPFVTMRYDN